MVDYCIIQNGKVIDECKADNAYEAMFKLHAHMNDPTKVLLLVVGGQAPVRTLLPQETEID